MLYGFPCLFRGMHHKSPQATYVSSYIYKLREVATITTHSHTFTNNSEARSWRLFEESFMHLV